MDSQVHSLRANLKSLSCHDESLPLRFPRLEHLSFDTWSSSASEHSDLLLQLATHQPQLLAHLQDLDLSTCQVRAASCCQWRAAVTEQPRRVC